MQFLFAGVETGQDDGNGRPVDIARLMQPCSHHDPVVRNLDSLKGRIQSRCAGRIAPQHAVMRRAKLLRSVSEQMLPGMKINRGTDECLRRGNAKALRLRLFGEGFVTRARF